MKVLKLCFISALLAGLAESQLERQSLPISEY